MVSLFSQSVLHATYRVRTIEILIMLRLNVRDVSWADRADYFSLKDRPQRIFTLSPVFPHSRKLL